jgi:hypothetical protein
MGILRITVDHSVRIEAQSARVHAWVHGSSTFGSPVAAKKSAVVREIVADLAAAGVGEDAVEVARIRLATREGKLVNASTIRVDLVVTAVPDELPAVLGVLADRPGVGVEHVEWVYGEFEASIPATAAAMAMARRKADAVASAAGLEVTGIANASDSWSMPSPGPESGGGMMYAAAARSASAPLDLGLELRASTELSVHLSVDFQLSS